MALPKQTPEARLTEVIAACAAAGPTTHDAASLLVERVRADNELYWAITEDDLFRICLAKVAHHNRSRVTGPIYRAALAVVSPPVLETARARTKQAITNARRATALANDLLSTTQMQSGRRLKDATHAELLSDAAFHGKQGRTMLHKERWFLAIAEHMDPAQAVAASITPEQALELFENALEAA